MIHIIWGVLNIAILFYFIIVCFQSVKLIREKLGILATLIFIFGLGGIITHSDNRDNETERDNRQHRTSEKQMLQGNMYDTDVVLEKDLTTEIELHITSGKNAAGKTLLSASASRSGFVSGTSWHVEMINVDTLADSITCSYDVIGHLDWEILGLRFYTETKDFSGKVVLKH